MNKAVITLESLRLASGSHKKPEDGLCVLEAVAYFRGIPHTDHPKCVSEVIGAFLRSWNDSLDDESRQMLKPYILKVVGTAGTAEDEERRGWLATDWLVRTCAPAWLDLANLTTHAAKLRALPELTTSEIVRAAQADIAAARNAAGAAARDAAWAAAWDAARDAAWAAAWDAARDTTRDVLQPTVVTLQASALELLERMIAVKRVKSA